MNAPLGRGDHFVHQTRETICHNFGNLCYHNFLQSKALKHTIYFIRIKEQIEEHVIISVPICEESNLNQNFKWVTNDEEQPVSGTANPDVLGTANPGKPQHKSLSQFCHNDRLFM